MITICKMQHEPWLGSQNDQILQLCGETLSEEYSAGRAPTSHSCWRNNTVAGERIDSAGDILHRTQSTRGLRLGNNQSNFAEDYPTATALRNHQYYSTGESKQGNSLGSNKTLLGITRRLHWGEPTNPQVEHTALGNKCCSAGDDPLNPHIG